MDHSQRLRELWDRYLKRDLPPAEVEELVSLLAHADAEDVLSEPMRRVWEELKSRPVEHAVDWDRMYEQVSHAEEGLSELSQRRGGLWRGESWAMRREVWSWRAAAVVFLVLAGLAAYWSVNYRRPAVAGVAGTAVNPGKTLITKDSAAAEMSWQTAENKKVIHLPDGSMVILNRHSRVEYRAVGAMGMREVTLNGEAYFDVVHRPGQPFQVRTGRILTRVLGTAFNIKAYPAGKSIEVTVDHGEVQVLKGGANVGLLSDKQQIRYDLGTENCNTLRVSLKPVMAWKPAEISFDDITMGEAARRIGERFKVGFDFVNPALKECRITATFYMEDDLDEIMTVICGVNQSRFTIGGNTVKIDGKGCN
ncbi:MAG TPA: FecR domain-containing protein [Puia sp.]|jgi:ferric-dicitrate binding protein FerR (iron transport regulator)|nr:FecR domain-containing protein [Puia sp.]